MAQHNVQDLHIGALHAHAAHAAHSGNGVLHAVHGQALAGLEHPLLQAHLQTGKGALQRGGDLGGAGGLRSVAHHAADGADAVGDGVAHHPVQRFLRNFALQLQVGHAAGRTGGRAHRAAERRELAD